MKLNDTMQATTKEDNHNSAGKLPVLDVTQQASRREKAMQLLARDSADSDVRLEKVAALRAAIAAGTYHVPSYVLAGKLMESMMVPR